MATVNYGLVVGIKSSTTAPENDRLIWYDENLSIHKRKKAGVWSAFELERETKEIDSDYTVTADDFCVIAHSAANDIIVTLPDPATFNAPFFIGRIGVTGYDVGGSKFWTIKVTGNINGINQTITIFNEYGAAAVQAGMWGHISTGPTTRTWVPILTEPKSPYKGVFADEAAINAAYPVGVKGWYVLNEDTVTFWVWDGSAWVDTGSSEDIDDTPRAGAIAVTEGENDINFSPAFTIIPQRYQVQARDNNGNPIDVRIPPGQIRVNEFKVYASAAGTLFYEFNRV